MTPTQKRAAVARAEHHWSIYGIDGQAYAACKRLVADGVGTIWWGAEGVRQKITFTDTSRTQPGHGQP